MKVIDASSSEFDDYWARLQANAGWRHALYGPLNLKFYSAYHLDKFTDCSMLVVIGDAPIAGLRVTSHADESGTTVFSCFGHPTLYCESRASGVRARNDAYAAVKVHMDALCAGSSRWRWIHAEHLDGGYVSAFGRRLFSLGGVPTVVTTQVIDLSESEERLFSALTKSFRWSVNWGRKNLRVRLLDRANIQLDDIEAFRALHIEASGRETRTHETWRRQLEMVRGDEAFVCFGELDGRLVTAALFPYSPDHCYYGVSASARELFRKPLSHVLLWEAILKARSLGCRWFETGDLRFPYQVPFPSDKELSISTFKRNFGGRTCVRLRITLESRRSR